MAYGTDTKFIQERMGHADIKTTMWYLHMSNQSIKKIISPWIKCKVVCLPLVRCERQYEKTLRAFCIVGSNDLIKNDFTTN